MNERVPAPPLSSAEYDEVVRFRLDRPGLQGNVVQREDAIDGIEDLGVLRERLKFAEEALVIFSWTGVRRDEGPRERLEYEAWERWHRAVPNASDVKANQRINNLVSDEERRWAERAGS